VYKFVLDRTKRNSTLGRRGPKSVSEILITAGPNGVIAAAPDAPYTLTDLEADEWRAITSAMPPDYFARSHFPLLSQLCRHVVAADFIGALLARTYKSKKIDRAEYAALLALQSAESSAITRLMRSLRLTHQSIHRAESAKLRPISLLDAPWHSDRQPWDRKDKTKP
jgi:hypothetical protein